MYHDFSFSDVLASSAKAAWQVEDVLPAGAKLDFKRRFLPVTLARTDELAFPSDDEKRVLNRIRGHEYLTLVGVTEEFILPFLLDHACPQPNGDDRRVRALLNLASEEAGTAGRKFGEQRREHLQAQQHRALRRTYPGSGMVHPKFTAALAEPCPAARDRIAAVAPACR